MKTAAEKSLNSANFHTANLILLLATKAMNGPKLTSTLTNLTGIFSTAVFFTPTSFEFHAVSVTFLVKMNISTKKPTITPSDIKDYRPFSLLLFHFKTLEHAVLTKPSAYLDQNNYYDPHKVCFKASFSIEIALLALTRNSPLLVWSPCTSSSSCYTFSAAFDQIMFMEKPFSVLFPVFKCF